MAEIYFDVDVALAEVPVNVFPLTDDTDFKSRETSVAYNAAGMDLVWNFVTSAGAYTQTAVTPTTAGDYDWTHQGDGMYSIEIPASGGASINNDSEGYGWFSGFATGVMPWRGPIIGFRAAALNDALVDSGNLLSLLGSQTSGTLSGTHSSTTADLGTNAPSQDIAGMTLLIPSRAFSRLITSYATGTGVATFDSTSETLANNDLWYLIATPPASTASPAPVNVVQISDDSTAANNLESACDNYSATRGLAGTALPNAAAGAANGLPTDSTGKTSFNDITAANVNTEVVDALNTDTYAEPGQGTPGATISLAQKIGYLYKAFRNRSTQTSSQYSLYNDDATTVDQKATFSDDSTTADRGEISTGP